MKTVKIIFPGKMPCFSFLVANAVLLECLRGKSVGAKLSATKAFFLRTERVRVVHSRPTEIFVFHTTLLRGYYSNKSSQVSIT